MAVGEGSTRLCAAGREACRPAQPAYPAALALITSALTLLFLKMVSAAWICWEVVTSFCGGAREHRSVRLFRLHRSVSSSRLRLLTTQRTLTFGAPGSAPAALQPLGLTTIS